MIKFIKKRDGKIVVFDQGRITKAVFKAMTAAGEGKLKDAEKVSVTVVRDLARRYKTGGVPGVEDIQDLVESRLILGDCPKTAKAYILYRQERARLREKKKIIPPRVRALVNESKKYFRNPLSEFIYYRTYSRWIAEEGRRETWVETVQRYLDFMRENLKSALSEEEYQEIKDAILRQQVMPSMRLMWSAGKAARNTNVAAYNCSFIAPAKIQDFAEIMYLLMCGTGVGFSVEQKTVQKLPQIKMQTDKKLTAHVVKDSKEGWAEALAFGMQAWFSGKDIDFDYSEVRQMGARLKTMGGRSAGPDPLRQVLDFIRMRILARQGRRLSSLDVHDLICKIGEVVVMGGVRRSALISLSDLDDQEMRFAKDGQFYLTEPQRSMANNSAVYAEKPTANQFLDEWIALAKSGTGERGIFNRAGLKQQMPARRWKAFQRDMDTSGTNPCVPADTWVMTVDGAKQVQELIGKSFRSAVNGSIYPSAGFFKTGTKDIFEIRTNRGFSVKATENHRILVVDYKTRKIQRNVWKEVKDIKPGDKVVLHNHKFMEWSGKGMESEGWLLGNLLGDGNIEKNGKANLDYWGITQPAMMRQVVSLVQTAVGSRKDLTGHVSKTGYGRIQSVNLGKLASEYGMGYQNKVVTDEIEKDSSDFYKGFLSGWFDADGSVQGNQKRGVSVRLSSSFLYNLKRGQRMLARLGIISTIYENRRVAAMRFLPDGKGGRKSYWCEANHELIISGSNILVFEKRINFSDPEKRNKLEKIIGKYRRRLNGEFFSSAVTEIALIGKEDVYDCRVPNINAFDGNGIYLHNCGEIILKSKEFCNLSEVVARPEDTRESLLKKTRLAAILGTYQSTLTKFPYLSKEWKKNCEEERLLGVSITGQWDCKLVQDKKILQQMRELAIETNKTYAARFGIKPSRSITCVKPSGTVSQLVDASSGLHPRHASHYIRRVRISSSDSLFKMLKDQKVPFHSEVGQNIDSATTYVLDFPMKAPKGSLFKNDLSALDQLEHWKLVKENFTEHNPSVTISVGPNEWIGVANWVYENWDMIGGLSFLPREEHVYKLAPYEEISKENYEAMTKSFPDIDFSQILLYEKEDDTKGSHELACVSGVCDII